MSDECFFQYGEAETDYLKRADPRLALVIDKVGHINRVVIPDLFMALVNAIVGQQISTRTQTKIWQRMTEALPVMTPEVISSMEPADLQAFGLPLRKVVYMQDAARKILSGEFDIQALREMDDDEVIKQLTSLDGVGKWTAEMLMLFSMQRPDILCFSDNAIQRGMRIVYNRRQIKRTTFRKYHRRLSPYGSVASLYFWEAAGGAARGLLDLYLMPSDPILDESDQISDESNQVTDEPVPILFIGHITR